MLPGPASRHLEDIKHLAVSQSQQCVIWGHQTCGRVLPGPSFCHLIVQFLSSICNVCFWYFRHHNCGRTSTFIMLEVPTVLPGPASCHLGDIKAVAGPAGPLLSSCWKYQQCCQGQHLVIWKTPKLWQGQHFYLVESTNSVWKASNLWQGDARAGILASLSAMCVFHLQCMCLVFCTSELWQNQHFHHAGSTLCCQGQHLVIWKTPKLWQGQHFDLVESINSVAKASRSTNSASRASILSSGKHQSCGRASRASTFIMLEVPTVLPVPTAEIPTVLPGPASCHLEDIKAVAGPAGPALSSCWKYQQCCQGQQQKYQQCCQGQHLVICKTSKLWQGQQGQHFHHVGSTNSVAKANILPSGRHETSDQATTFLFWTVSTMLPGPASCHLQDIKLLAGSQSQQCIIWKASSLWQGVARASILSSLSAMCVFHLQCMYLVFYTSELWQNQHFRQLEVHCVARANILSSGRHQNCGKDNTLNWLKVSTVLPRPAEVPTVLPGPAYCHLEDIKAVAGPAGPPLSSCWKYQQCCQGQYLVIWKTPQLCNCGKDSPLICLKLPTVLPGPAS